MVEKIAAFLKERDEAMGTNHADDEERTESAKLIIKECVSRPPRSNTEKLKLF